MPTRRQKKLTQAQELLRTHLSELGLRTEAEYQWDDERKWRADLACLEHHILFEVDGGKWHGGHRRGKALEDDYERQNSAILDGWRLLRFTNEQVMDGRAKKWLEEWL
jgi:very-short-patch-repair endonuclease